MCGIAVVDVSIANCKDMKTFSGDWRDGSTVGDAGCDQAVKVPATPRLCMRLNNLHAKGNQWLTAAKKESLRTILVKLYC